MSARAHASLFALSSFALLVLAACPELDPPAALDDSTRAQGARLYVPELRYCTDNGAMIAYAGALRLLAGQRDATPVEVLPRWSLEDLEAI